MLSVLPMLHALVSLVSSSSLLVPARNVFLYVDPCQERLHVLPSLERRDCECVLLHSRAAAAAILRRLDESADDADDVRERVDANVVPPVGGEVEWLRTVIPGDFTLCGVLCGSDGGLADAERLQHALSPTRSNGINPARRDKYSMVEAMRAAGLAAAAQARPRCWDESLSFIRTQKLPVVLKPRRGQASVLVGLAKSEEAAERMDAVLRDSSVSIDDAGLVQSTDLRCSSPSPSPTPPCDKVVIQQFIEGEEWVVDTVSRDGEHKALALWRYDKGAANGAPFVYFCDELRPVSGKMEASLIAYAFEVLDALGWRWGACHIELKLALNLQTPLKSELGAEAGKEGDADESGSAETAPTPVLIEINAGRWNGVEFQQLVSICTGYDSYEACLDAYLDRSAWDQIPAAPPQELRGCARLVKLVSSVEGELAQLPGSAAGHASTLNAMESLLRFEPEPSEVGEAVSVTVDLATCAGYAHLLHADETVVQYDYEALRKLQPSLFKVR